MTLENQVAYIRKEAEHIEELTDILNALKSDYQVRVDDLFAIFSNNPKLYNVCKHKKVASGFVGNELVQFNFGEKIVRRDGKRDDDQEWLLTRRATDAGLDYVVMGYRLNKAKIKADYAAGLIGDDVLEALDVTFEPTYNVTIRRLPNAAEIDAVKEAALELAEKAEEAE